ncbi:hypothetical protein ACLOJK_031806, partial [Asimina triloba]
MDAAGASGSWMRAGASMGARGRGWRAAGCWPCGDRSSIIGWADGGAWDVLRSEICAGQALLAVDGLLDHGERKWGLLMGLIGEDDGASYWCSVLWRSTADC